MSPPSEDRPGDDFGATTLDREAISFEDLEELAQTSEAAGSGGGPTRDVAGPKWAGTLPGTDRVPAPVQAPPPVVAPEPVAVAPPEPVAPEPENLAATTLHQKIYEVPAEALPAPPLDQLREDNRVAAAGRAAGLQAGSTTPDTEDKLLKVGLAVVIGLIVLLVLGVCAGITSTLLDPLPEESGDVVE